MKKLLLATILATLSFSAAADQCYLLDKADAEKGVQVLSKSTTAYKLCEPCGETTPEKIQIADVKMVDANYNGWFEVQVNGEGVDLAYIFDHYGKNVALQTNCYATDVSASIGVQ